MKRWPTSFVPMLLAVALTAATAAVAQQAKQVPPAEGAEPAPEEPAAPQPISAAAVNGKADEAMATLADVRASLSQVDLTAPIEQDLTKLLDDLAGQRDKLDPESLASDYTVPALDDLKQRWERAKSTLDTWYGQLDARSQELQGSQEELKQLQDLWVLTRDSAADQEFPEAIVERVGATIAGIAEVRGLIEQRLEKVLTLQSRISGYRTELAQILANIDVALDVVRKQLLSIDSPPLWRSLGEGGPRTSIAGQFGSSVRQVRDGLADFRQLYRTRIYGHLIIFVLLLLTLVTMWRRAGVKTGEGDEDRDIAVRIVSAPLANALLLCLFPVFWVYPSAPLSVYHLTMVVLMLPLLRILTRITPANMHGPLFGMAAAFVVLKAYELSMDESLLERLLLLSVSGVGAAGLAWLVRPGGRATTLHAGGLWKTAVFLLRASAVALAVAFVTNVIGNVGLAAMLTKEIMTAIYAGILIFGFAIALRSVIAVALGLPPLCNLRSVANNRDVIKRRGIGILRFAGVGFWIWVCLAVFEIRDEVVSGVRTAFGYRFGTESFTISLGDVFVFFLSLWIAAQISKFVRWIFGEDILPRVKLPRGLASSMSTLVHWSIMALGFLFAIAAIGIDIDRIAIVLGALGVGIGFGLQGLVNNFVSGLVLIFERPINVGDTVQLAGGLMGDVRRIGIRASVVRTFEGAEVIVPNGNLISAELTNWTLSDRLRRIEIPVGVAYGTDPDRVLEILVAAARGQKDVLDFPEPYALFKGFGDSSLDFVLRFWTSNFDWWIKVASHVTVSVSNGLAEADITIPFPQRDLHFKSMTETAREALSAERADAAPEAADGGS